MVKEVETDELYFECDVCGNAAGERKYAEECEARGVTKATWPELDSWKVGDLIEVYHHDFGWNLALVVDEKVRGHLIHPIVEVVRPDMDEFFSDSWHAEIYRKASDKYKKMVALWAKVLEGVDTNGN